MVNMNITGDKENQPNKINRVNQDLLPCSSTISDEPNEKTVSQTNINGNSDCNKLPLINGTYNKLNSVSCTSSSSTSITCEPSTSRLAQVRYSEPANIENVNSERGASAQGSLLGNNPDCQDYENRSENVRNQYKAKERQACKYELSSSSEDEECCIYTYKGDSGQMADLPSSFFRLDFTPSRQRPNSRNSSPDMDYLEMDFDPGPSNDRDSSSDSECDGARLEEEEMFPAEVSSLPKPRQSCEPTPEPVVEPEYNSPTPVSPVSTPSPIFSLRPQASPDRPNSSSLIHSPPLSPQMRPKTPEAERESLRSFYCYCASNSQSSLTIDENFNDGDSGTMIWKEEEAKEKQATQIRPSACGATAVINTLLALNVPCTVNAVRQCVNTRLRQETAPLPEYLFSRSNAGSTHVDVIQGLQAASQDLVYARFFHMYPQRSISLTSWLSYWIRKGAVPIVTVNPQQDASAGASADCWRHQMVHGVSTRGIHLTDPLDAQSELRLRIQLSSPSELRVAREDVLSRWDPDADLLTLTDPTRPLWRNFNVLGQVVNVVREGRSGNPSRTHVNIPASYSSGVILAMLQTNPACNELRLAPELPVDPFATR